MDSKKPSWNETNESAEQAGANTCRREGAMGYVYHKEIEKLIPSFKIGEKTKDSIQLSRKPRSGRRRGRGRRANIKDYTLGGSALLRRET